MATDHSAATASGLDHLHIYATDFTALNNSGVDGHAILLLDEKAQTLKVFITAEGMESGQVHAQHIHGFPDDREAMPPTIAQDADGDGFVELLEGLVKYGPIQLNLTTTPRTPPTTTAPAATTTPARRCSPPRTGTACCATPRPSASPPPIRTRRRSSTTSSRWRPRRSCCTA
jgi:hypothetical protein